MMTLNEKLLLLALHPRLNNKEISLNHMYDGWYVEADNPVTAVCLGESAGLWLSGTFKTPEEAVDDLLAKLNA